MTCAKFFCIKSAIEDSTPQCNYVCKGTKKVGWMQTSAHSLVRSENKQLIMTPYHANTVLY